MRWMTGFLALALMVAVGCGGDDKSGDESNNAVNNDAPNNDAPNNDAPNNANNDTPDAGAPDADEPDADEPDADEPPEDLPLEPVQARQYPLDDTLRVNHMQVLGTHNSYHLEPERAVDPSHRYSHDPLDVQLEVRGVRQFELDLHLNLEGRFEIFHLPAIDKETTCATLRRCMEVIKRWSDLRPGHLPIVVWFEPKDEVEVRVDPEVLGYQAISGHFDALEAELLEVWPRERIFTPDDLRGEAATLPEAIAARGGWPTLGELRQKIIFVMLDGGDHRAEYLEGNPALEGRLLFVNSGSAEEPFAAAFKIDNAANDGERIRALAEAGFLITSNADGAGGTPEENQADFEQTLASGAHHLASDLPGAVEGASYRGVIPEGEPARCNPVTAPPECTSGDLEGFEPAP